MRDGYYWIDRWNWSYLSRSIKLSDSRVALLVLTIVYWILDWGNLDFCCWRDRSSRSNYLPNQEESNRVIIFAFSSHLASYFCKWEFYYLEIKIISTISYQLFLRPSSTEPFSSFSTKASISKNAQPESFSYSCWSTLETRAVEEGQTASLRNLEFQVEENWEIMHQIYIIRVSQEEVIHGFPVG